MSSSALASSSSPPLPSPSLVESGAANANASPLHSVDPAVFRSYLLALLPPIFGASLEALESTLFDDEFDERIVKFASEGGGVIYVTKSRIDLEGGLGIPYNLLCIIQVFMAGLDEGLLSYSYHLTSQLAYTPTTLMTVALIKRTPILDTLIPLASQLNVLNLFGGEETPYESLHALVSYAVKPWFDAFVGARSGGTKDGDGKMGIPMTKRKFAELELSLLHLQQNVEIPETHLIIHPVIQRAVAQVSCHYNDPLYISGLMLLRRLKQMALDLPLAIYLPTFCPTAPSSILSRDTSICGSNLYRRSRS
jgi:dynein heavy chain 1